MTAVIDKAELKRRVLQEVGKELDKKREGAEQEVHRLDGGRSSLALAAQKVEGHKSYWQKDFDEGRCSAEELTAALKAIDQCAGILRNLSDSAMTNKLIKQGELAAFDKSSDICEKLFDAEGAKAQAFLDAIERGDVTHDGLPTDNAVAGGAAGRPPLRVIGQHPGANVAQARKQQEAAAKAEVEAEADESKDPPSPDPKGNGEAKEPKTTKKTEAKKPEVKKSESKKTEAKKPDMPPARRRRRKAASKEKSQ